MSVTALVVGRLIADPERRVGQSGKSFTLARIGTVAEDGCDVLVSAIAFSSVGEQLAALGKGDSVAITGRAKVTTWTSSKDGATKAGLSITADGLLTSYHVRRKRAAMCQAQGQWPDFPDDGAGREPPGRPPQRDHANTYQRGRDGC